MKRYFRVFLLSILLLTISYTTVWAASGSYGPNNSLRWNDNITYIPMKKVQMETWDPQGRTNLRWQSEACLGAKSGSSAEYCALGKAATGFGKSIAIRERLFGGTAYTYAYWAYN